MWRYVIVIGALAAVFAAGWFFGKPLIGYIKQTYTDIKNKPQSSSQPQQSSEGQQSGPASTGGDVVPAGGITAAPLALADVAALKTAEAAAQAAQALKAQGAGQVLITLKDEKGNIFYNSAVEATASLKADGIEDLAAVLGAFTTNGVKPAVYINAFRDELAPYAMRDAAVKYKGDTKYLWLDGTTDKGGKPWLNPYSAQATGYIKDIVAEVVAAGGSDIIVGGIQFPTGHGLDLGFYGDTTTTKQAVLAAFISELNALAAQKGAVMYYEFPLVAFTADGAAQYGAVALEFKAVNYIVQVNAAEADVAAKLAALAAQFSEQSAATCFVRITGAAAGSEQYVAAATAAQAAGLKVIG